MILLTGSRLVFEGSLRQDLQEIYNEIQPEYDKTHVPFDNNSLVKLANTFCRLELKDRLTDDVFDRTKMEFQQLYKELEDAKIDLKMTKIERETYTKLPDSTPDNIANLSSKEIRILRIVQRISDEQGIEWVSLDDIKNHPDFDIKRIPRYFDSIIKLVNVGFLIMRNNWNEFKYVDMRR